MIIRAIFVGVSRVRSGADERPRAVLDDILVLGLDVREFLPQLGAYLGVCLPPLDLGELVREGLSLLNETGPEPRCLLDPAVRLGQMRLQGPLRLRR